MYRSASAPGLPLRLDFHRIDRATGLRPGSQPDGQLNGQPLEFLLVLR